ncbi:Di-copper centre-containing protein [Delitschia confertaspora ATCC 74209]|uniref:Di-copper centre-containing protein n=1 Tax=Delitschia confertaspora ATCC 74209 TaxID=1513339 RepID=A0A9P4MWE6_9PLEO|nr:Di-copper centre-containing protein [Delitschia confertaspora ATCC 74209]
MHINLYLLASLLAQGISAGPTKRRSTLRERVNGPYPLDVVDKLQEASLPKFDAYLKKNSTKNASGGCTLDNAARRLEWSDLTISQRKEYIDAVLCLQKLPPKSPRDKFPGALSRYDDFVATHESQAMELHSTPHLLPAHRLYIRAYEQALRNECGYTGYQPYWNWDRYAADPINSPLFNGNATSMSGNGLPSDYPGVFTGFTNKPYDIIPAAGGGGCVTEGPFANMTVSLGPIGIIVNDIPKNPQTDGFGSNPRCLRRDVNKFAAAVTTANYTYALITENKDVDGFQSAMLGSSEKNDWGVHLGGHYTIGGDPGGDFFSSPGDPVFWFHHGMIDRIWWIWQMQDPENRMNVVPGTPNATIPGYAGGPALPDDGVDLNWSAPKAWVRDLLTNIGGFEGQFCYIYD